LKTRGEPRQQWASDQFAQTLSPMQSPDPHVGGKVPNCGINVVQCILGGHEFSTHGPRIVPLQAQQPVVRLQAPQVPGTEHAPAMSPHSAPQSVVASHA